METLKTLIREIPDFPKAGILFYDITTLLKEPAGLRGVIDGLKEHYQDAKVDAVIGIEARGFIFAPALAYALGAGFVPVRKPKKLPAECARITYDLEYGTDTLEMHRDAVSRGQARFDRRRFAGNGRNRRGGGAHGARTRRRSGGHGVRGGAHVLERKTQAGWTRCVLADSVRQMSNIRRATLPALAKINLDLRVIGKREDGYHELRTIFQTISLADSIELSFAAATAYVDRAGRSAGDSG